MTEDEILAWCGSIERRPLPETRYTLSEMIAFGGFGAVFDAHLVDGASGSAVPPDVRFVVKIFHPNLYADPSHRKLIDAECENSRTVSHQLRSANLVTTFEHLQLQLPGGQSTVGIVQEQCSTTLEKAVARITGEDRQFEPPDLFHLVRGLLLGVQSLHDAGLVHGDLKPSNILLHAGGVDLLRHGASLLQLTPKVADFTTLGKVGEPAPKLAKDKWRPPENYQLDSVENWIPIARNASPQTDVYAAGKIIQWLCQKTKRCPTPIQRLADRMISDKLDARPVAVDRHLVSQASQDFDLIALLKNAGYSPERHPVFVGRKATLQRIDNCERHVAKDPECGRLTLLVGESGIGKSAIMHHLSAPSDHTAGHPAFFFIRERRQSAEQMLRTLIEMVRKRYPSVTKDIEARRENPETEFAELIAAAGAAEFESGCILRVLIDAVDESCNPVAVTRGLPLHIPSGVHLIVAMRPAAGAGLDSYLTPLQTVSHIDQIDLTRNSGCNRDDLREYFQDRRKEVGTDPELLEALVDATGGIFRIAVVIADQLLATDRPLPSPSTVKNFSIASGAGEAERLMRVYQHSWQQLKGWIEESYDSAMLAKHVDFLGYLSVAQSPLTESQLCVWLQCDAAEIQQMFENTHWLIQQRFDDNDIHQSLPHYALSHASVGEFLVSRQFGGPLLSRNRLHRYQAAIAKHHFDQADRDGWRRVDAYGRSFAVSHALQSSDQDLHQRAHDALGTFAYHDARMGNGTIEDVTVTGEVAAIELERIGDDFQALSRVLRQGNRTVSANASALESFVRLRGEMIEQEPSALGFIPKLYPRDHLVYQLAQADTGNRFLHWQPKTNRRDFDGVVIGRHGKHDGGIYTVTVTPDGKRAVSGGIDGNVLLWDLDEHRVVTLSGEGHSTSVKSVSVTPDGKRAVSGGNDGKVLLWDLDQHHVVPLSGEGHSDSVLCVSIAPDGNRAVSGGDDGKVLLWDLDKYGVVPLSGNGHSGAVNSVSVTADGKRAVSGGDDEEVRLWDLEKHHEVLLRGEGHSDRVQSVSVTANGKCAVSGGWDGKVLLWDLDEHGVVPLSGNGHSGTVNSVSVTADGKRAVSGGTDGKVLLWDLDEHCIVPLSGKGHSGSVYSVIATADGKRAVSGGPDRNVLGWDLEKHCVMPLSGNGHSGTVNSVSVTADGRCAVSGGDDGKTLLWNMDKQSVLPLSDDGHSGTVCSVSVTSDGKRAISSGDYGEVLLWNMDNQTVVPLSSDGHSGKVYSASLTSDGKRAVAGGSDGKVLTWDLDEPVVEPVFGGQRLSSVYSVSVTSDGKRAVSCGEDYRLLVWDLGLNQIVPHSEIGTDCKVCSVSVTSDGNRAVVATLSGRVLLWELDTQQIVPLSDEAHIRFPRVNSVRVTSDGRYAVSGGSDGKVLLWDLDQPRIVPLSGECHSDSVRSVSVTADGKRAVSGGDDGKVLLWDLNHRCLVTTLVFPSSVFAVDLSLNGVLVTGEASGAVRAYKVPDAVWIGFDHRE